MTPYSNWCSGRSASRPSRKPSTSEVERDLISERTKEGLAAARAKDRRLGHPKGTLGKSKLDGKEEEIRILLQKQVSKASIAKIVGVSRTSMHHFINLRKLDRSQSFTAAGTSLSSLKDMFAAIWAVP